MATKTPKQPSQGSFHDAENAKNQTHDRNEGQTQSQRGPSQEKYEPSRKREKARENMNYPKNAPHQKNEEEGEDLFPKNQKSNTQWKPNPSTQKPNKYGRDYQLEDKDLTE